MIKIFMFIQIILIKLEQNHRWQDGFYETYDCMHKCHEFYKY